MTTKNLGNAGFVWFIGKVEDRNDPMNLGRVRVRIYNLHTQDINEIRTEDLPWSMLLMPPTSASQNNIGMSPTGIEVGSHVIGFFLDAYEHQMPVVMGTFHGMPDLDSNKNDVAKLARGINSITKNKIGPEPDSAYGAKYPYNKVTQSESGHVIEVDDTPNKERLHVYHKSGTYVEVDHTGRTVVKVAGDNFTIVAGDDTVFINKNQTTKIKGDSATDVDGKLNMNIDKTLNIKVKGSATIDSDSNINIKSGGNLTATIGGSANIRCDGSLTLSSPDINIRERN
jgi:hypothetical protein